MVACGVSIVANKFRITIINSSFGQKVSLLNGVWWKLLLILASSQIATEANGPDHDHDKKQQAQAE